MVSSNKYLLKSTTDEIILEINETVINSSMLLKNVSELTDINPSVPIEIDCGSKYLNKFVQLIQIHEEYANDEKIFNIKIFKLFQDFKDDALADFIKETCILDSDILLDAIADIILDKMKDMSREEINEYLEIEDDFTADEREWQRKNMLKYFISLNDPSFPLQFPLPSSNFYSIKTKFSSPLNILLSRICQRADDSLAFRLSMCSKPLKNECDRHPIKVTKFCMSFFCWLFEIEKENMKWNIELNNKNEKYFSAICHRHLMAWNDDIKLSYGHSSFLEDQFNIFKKRAYSLEWMIPHKNVKKIKVSFSDFDIFISSFDLKKFPFSNIVCELLFQREIDFSFVYDHLIAKDLSKAVKLRFDFSQNMFICISKKSSSARFFECHCYIRNKKENLAPKFKAFLTKYFEFHGHIKFNKPPSVLPEQIADIFSLNPHQEYCFISDVLKYL